jgi:hypothetical protein
MPSAADSISGAPLAFDQFAYVPVLMARSAEFSAVASMQADAIRGLYPIWVVPPIARDPRTNEVKKPIEDHLATVMRNLLKSWSAPPFIDTHQISLADPSEQSILGRCIELANEQGRTAIAVLHENSPAEDFAVVKRNQGSPTQQIALRLGAAVWANVGTIRGDAVLADLVSATGRNLEDIHLVLDLADQVSSPAALTIAAVKASLLKLSRLHEWRTVTVLGTSMPPTTSAIDRHTAQELPRPEWDLWKALKTGPHRRVSFGDYAIQSIDALSNYNPLTMQTAAQIRYTIPTAWYVARGASLKTTGFDQIHHLASLIAAHPDFCGREFSWGDEWIANAAVRAVGTGNATTWRRAGTSHHLTFVLAQLSAQRAS